MSVVERWTWRDQRAAGVVHTVIGVGGAWLVGVGLRRAIGPTGATALATAVAVAGRMLDTEAMAVADLLAASDLAAARRRRAGRSSGVTRRGSMPPASPRAVVESVAENTTDAVVAPACGQRSAGRRPCSPTARSTRSTRWSATAHRATSASGGRPPASTTSPTPSPPSSARCSSPRGARRAGGPWARRRRRRRPPPVAERRPHRGGVRRLARRDARWRQPLRRRGRGSRSARHRPRPGARGHRPRRAAAPVGRPRARRRADRRRRHRSARRRPRRRSHDRLASSSQLTASARRSVVAT